VPHGQFHNIALRQFGNGLVGILNGYRACTGCPRLPFELAREITNSDMPHLDRDWAAEQQQYEELQKRIQTAAHLNETLHHDPRSWLSLKAAGSPQDTP
jgi:hypothetical protein